MRTLTLLCLGLFLGTTLGCRPGATGAGGKPLVTVDGTAITEGDLQQLAERGPPHLKARLESPGGKKQIVDFLVDRELLYAEGVRRGLDRDAGVAAQLEQMRRGAVAEAVLRDALDAEAKKYYDSHADEFTTVEIRHLLVRVAAEPEKAGKPKGAREPAPEAKGHSDAEAVTLINQLKTRMTGGEAFVEVAKSASEDARTKDSGGSLGPVARKEPRLMRRGWEPLLETAFGLKPDEVGGPIKTKEGYHLVQVVGAPALQPFDKAKDGILPKLQGQIRKDVIGALKKQKSIIYSPELTNAPAPPTPDAPGAGALPPGMPPPPQGMRPPHPPHPPHANEHPADSNAAASH